MTPRNVDFNKNALRLDREAAAAAATAVSVCSVVKTRCPVQRRVDGNVCGLGVADLATMITSGSCRTKERKAEAKVRPIAGLT